jgi:4-amino-4-deoxy-L-arabinose transferase-like glycosyltransferase
MTRRPKLLLALLILASGALYLTGNGTVSLWDRDEPRYAQTSRQMLQSGDWVVPHYLDLVRTAKPALIYWCQAGAMELFGDNAFAARFPSAIATTLLLILLSFIFWRPLGPQRTFWTVFIFATSALVIASAKMCLTDAVLLLWITVAQLCLYSIWRGRASWKIVLIMSVATGLAGLTKGPVILGFLATTLIALAVLKWLDKKFPPRMLQDSPAANKLNFKSLAIKLFVGILVIVAIVLPWVLAVNHRAPAFVRTAVGHDVWDRIMTPLEQHTGPPGYYLLTIWGTFFPWSLFLPLAIGLAIRYRSDPKTRFALAAIIGPWIMLECIRTKLPHYFLPAFPPLAFLTADAIVRCLNGQHQDLNSKPVIGSIGLWAIFISILGLSPWLAIHFHQALPIPAMITISLFTILYTATIYTLFKARRSATAALAMGAGMMILVTILYTLYLPSANFLRLSPRVAEILIANGVTHPHQVIMLDYMEPSLAFYQGGTMREAGEVALNHRSIPNFTPWMVVTEDIWKIAPTDIREMFDVVAEVSGLAYADKWRWINVMVIHRKNGP